MVFSYYRLGHAVREISTEDRVLTGVFLTTNSENQFLKYFKPGWESFITDSIEQKIEQCLQSGISFDLSKIFPWQNEMSTGITFAEFCKSFLIQPDLFIRIRPGFEDQVKSKLSKHRIAYKELQVSSLQLPKATPVDKILELNKEAVIQDLSSQMTGDFFSLPEAINQKDARAWDCCAASGGKSILLHDRFPELNITASDIRQSILINLRKRLSEAGISKYESFVADLTKPLPNLAELRQPFELLLMDAPCSGSGTWSRNPEELFFFKKERIGYFRDLQEHIFSRAISRLKSNGILIYITCSVFHQENEGMVRFIRESTGLELLQSKLIKGYADKADTMFVASLRA